MLQKIVESKQRYVVTIETDYLSGTGIRKLAVKHGIGWRRIERRLIDSNISIREKSKEKFSTSEAVTNYKAGATIPQLSHLYKVSTTAIWERLKRTNTSRRNYKDYQKYNYDLSRLTNLSSEIGSYWFGFLLADGYITTSLHRRTAQRCLICKLSWRDYDHLKKLYKIVGINKLPQLICRFNKHRGKAYWSAVLAINSKQLCDFYMRKGWSDFKQGGSFKLNYINIRHFLRGLWDGDGTVSHSGKYLTMCYADMSCNIMKLIQRSIIKLVHRQTGITIRRNRIGSYLTRNRTRMYRTGWAGRQAVLIAKALYSNCNIVLERKFAKLKPYIS